MTSESVIHEVANRAFIAAFLLSGRADRAEAAVLEAIGFMNSGDPSGEDLLRRTVSRLIEREEIPGRRPMELEQAFSTLPFELQDVLHLPTYLRQCFVLRVLAGLTRETCARLLRSEAHQVDEGTWAAMLELPLIQQKQL